MLAAAISCVLADRLEVLLRDREQHAPEVVLDERGDRGQQRAERVDEPLGLLVVGQVGRAQRCAHVAVEQRDRLLGDVVRRCVVLAGEREQIGEREARLRAATGPRARPAMSAVV